MRCIKTKNQATLHYRLNEIRTSLCIYRGMIASRERWVWIVTCFTETFEFGLFLVLIIGEISYLFCLVKESSCYKLGTYSPTEPVIVRDCNQKWTVKHIFPKMAPIKMSRVSAQRQPSCSTQTNEWI